MTVHVTNLYLKPTLGATDQQITVAGSAVQFGAFSAATDVVMLQVLDDAVYATFDGSTPSSSDGFLLPANSTYNWSKSMAVAAKFISTGTAKIKAQECNT